MPTEKYAHAPEILEHCQRIGKQYGLYDNALFHTEVKDLEWDDDRSVWIIRTNRGDEFTAQFLGMGTGPLHVPKLPGIPGLEDFQGHSFHTSRWDYDYTGGDPEGAPMDKLADKRVAIIGTGATSVQAVPHLAPACGTLYVIQRTPSSVDVRDNRPTDPEWFATINTPGLAAALAGELHRQPDRRHGRGGPGDGRLDRPVPPHPQPDHVAAAGGVHARGDDGGLRGLRLREDGGDPRRGSTRSSPDPDTAQNLKAWYRQLCKRPCFHDEYLQAYNEPGTHLLDTDGKGVERITETGVVVQGVEYEVDCIIYASGFEVGTEYTRRTGYDMTGRDGVKLSEYWADGMRTKHGTHVHGFPNAFIVQPTQGANLISNVPHNLTESGKTIAMIVRHALDTGAREVEVTKEAEDAWIELLLSGPELGIIGSPDCTPGYYNNEGQPGGNRQFFVGYPMGAMAYFQYLDAWRNKGDFEGLEFR